MLEGKNYALRMGQSFSMRCIGSRYYGLGDGLSVVVGLKCFYDLTFKTVIVLLGASDCIVFEVREWQQFIKSDVQDYFTENKYVPMDCSTKKFLFYDEKRIIVIQCLKSWNTVKINHKQYINLKELKLLIDCKLNHCLHYEHYITFQVQYIKEKIAEECFKLDKCPSSVKLQDIRSEELVEEALIVFGKEVKTSISESLYVLKETNCLTGILKELEG